MRYIISVNGVASERSGLTYGIHGTEQICGVYGLDPQTLIIFPGCEPQ